MKLAFAVTVAAGLLLAACGGDGEPQSPATSSRATTQAPTSTSAPPSTEVTATSPAALVETGMMDETRAALIRQTVPTVRDVDTPRLVRVVDSMCRQLRGTVNASQIFRASLDQGFTEVESFGLLSAAVVTTCPSVAGKVTYDTVGWHP